MKVTWNGTGSAWSRRHGNSSAIVEAGGTRLLVDCGHTAPARLAEMGLSLRDIGAVFVSHLHGDHVYGLEEWGFKNFLVWNERPILLIADVLADALWHNVLAGTMAQVCNRSCVLDDYFEVVRLEVGRPQQIADLTIEIHPVEHVPNAPSFGAKISDATGPIGFTCDSLANVSPWFFDRTRLVFHDCSLQSHFPETVHAHFSELLEYPDDWRRRTRLVHYGDELEDLERDPRFAGQLSASGMQFCRSFQGIEV